MEYFIHKSSYIDKEVLIGKGTKFGISATSWAAPQSGKTASSDRTAVSVPM